MSIVPPLQYGELITSQQFNELVLAFEKIWSDTTPTAGPYDIDKSSHTRGWGQPSIAHMAVSAEDTISAWQINNLRSVINAALYHIDESSTLLSRYEYGAKVYALAYATIKSVLADMDGSSPNGHHDRVFDINAIDYEDSIEVISTSANLVWDEYLRINTIATFASYQEARYFFNSGGVVTFSLESINDSVSGDNYWDNIFQQMQEIRFGATSSYSAGSNPSSSVIPLGFDSVVSDSWTTVYTYSVTGGGEYGSGEYGGEYGGAYSEYGSAVATLKARSTIDSDTGEYGIEFELTLSEQTAGNANSNEIIIDAGYILPLDTPNDGYLNSGSSSNPFRGDDGVVYQFQEPTPPVVELEHDWRQSQGASITVVVSGY